MQSCDGIKHPKSRFRSYQLRQKRLWN